MSFLSTIYSRKRNVQLIELIILDVLGNISLTYKPFSLNFITTYLLKYNIL
jgi:hypothetical protein